MVSQVKRFVILAAPRSGSNMLASLLNSHREILCHHELYNPKGIFYALHLRNTPFSFGLDMTQRDQQPIEFLNRVWCFNQGHQWVGFKMTHQQNSAAFDALLEDHGIHKILLKRRNLFKQHVSRLLAEQSGVWERYANCREQNFKFDKNRVTVNLADLNRDIEFNDHFYKEIVERLIRDKQDCLDLDYEDLATEACHRRLCRFLNVEFQALSTNSLKQNPTDLSMKISNFDELLSECTDIDLRQQLLDTAI